MRFIPVKVDEQDQALDIPSMREMPDADYAQYVAQELFFFDHHENLRSNFGQYPIATTTGQIEVLIAYLQGIKARMDEAKS